MTTTERPVPRKQNASCPRGSYYGDQIRCSGATLDGVRITTGHTAPPEAFGHNQWACDRGRRCLQAVCRECMTYRRRHQAKLAEQYWSGMSDLMIRAFVGQKKCSGCKETLDARQFYVVRSNTTGLAARCISCTSIDKAERKKRATR